MITSLDQLDFSMHYSYADYLKWQLSEYVELIRGKIFKMAAPTSTHQRISMRMSNRIGPFLFQTSCEVFAAPFDVRLPRLSEKNNKEIFTVVQPDICVICDKNKIDIKGCIGAPDLIIEIVSPGNSKKEMKDKYSIYEEAGVKEYWIIHPEEKSVLRFILNETGKYIGLQPLTDDDIITSPILKGLEIQLSDIFKE
jgi:Uma2 family endonuclease